MNEMLRAITLPAALSFAFSYGCTILASTLDWPQAIGSVIAVLTFALFVGSGLVLMGPVERRHVRQRWGRRVRAMWHGMRVARTRSHR